MISRRQIRIKVMQAVYAWYCTDYHPGEGFDLNLKEFADEIRNFERQKGDKGDLRLLIELYYQTIEKRENLDGMIQQKAENWELDRIALIDRILMQMGITEMMNFEEIPIKVTINEYLEIAKKFSTPKSSKFINGILDSLYNDLKRGSQIQKRGRGLIEESIPKDRKRRPRINKNDSE
jgi:N utilization substance protein B